MPKESWVFTRLASQLSGLAAHLKDPLLEVYLWVIAINYTKHLLSNRSVASAFLLLSLSGYKSETSNV